MIRFNCPKCGKNLKAREAYAGQQVQCNGCKLFLSVPGGPVKAQGNGNRSPNPPPVPAAAKAQDQPPTLVESVFQAVRERPWLPWSVGGLLAVIVIAFVVYLLIPSELDQKLSDLKSSDAATSKPALEWLNEATPKDTQRAKVTAAMEPILLNGDIHKNLDPDMVLHVYLIWANKDNVPALVRMVETPPKTAWSSKKTGLVMDALGKMQDERAADALAAKLSDPTLHDQAVNALEVLGPKAETVVLSYRFDPDPNTRQRASQLLTNYKTKPQIIAAEASDRLRSDQAEVRRSAIVWFVENLPEGDFQKTTVGPALAKLLDDLSPEVCDQALQALKLWATKDCTPQLLAYSLRVQKNASGNLSLIEVLAQFKDDETAAEALAVQLANPKGRDKAYDALVTFGPVAEKAALQYINHPDEGAQKKARSLCRLLKVPADRLLAQTLTDLADTRAGRVRTALVNLARMRVDEANRAKISEALNASLLDPNVGIREDAVMAAKAWGTTQNTNALLKVLADFHASGKGNYLLVIDTLGALKDPRAAAVLAQGLTHASEREAVGKALLAIGPAAEDAVIPFLQNVDRDARLESCQILAEIGTSKSVQPLQNAIVYYGQDGVFYAEANLAIQKITARK